MSMSARSSFLACESSPVSCGVADLAHLSVAHQEEGRVPGPVQKKLHAVNAEGLSRGNDVRRVAWQRAAAAAARLHSKCGERELVGRPAALAPDHPGCNAHEDVPVHTRQCAAARTACKRCKEAHSTLQVGPNALHRERAVSRAEALQAASVQLELGRHQLGGHQEGCVASTPTSVTL